MVRCDYLTPEKLRLDGRRISEVRPLQIQSGGLAADADGSASVSMGGTKAVAYVYGPRACSRRNQQQYSGSLSNAAQVHVEYRTSTFSGVDRRKRTKGDRQSQEKAIWLEKIFERVILTDQFPRSQIEIVVEILVQDGSPVSAAINAITVALASAGLPMRDLVSSVTLGLLDSKTILVDLNHSESEHGSGAGSVCLAAYARTGRICLCEVESKIPIPAFEEALKLGTQSCLEIAQTIRTHLMDESESRLVSKRQ